MPKTKQQHLDGTNGPKRILALDGGGIRGILTLEYLEVMESEFRRRFNNPDFLLCDYFDLIGGTSTGSIIAAGLACGMTVEQLKKLYTGIGTDVFQAEFWRLGLLAPKFKSGSLQEALDGPQLATYARYNVLLEPGWLKTTVQARPSTRSRREDRGDG